ncbi:MAG: DMT family transporter [Hyphomicrobiaceae bacterium]
MELWIPITIFAAFMQNVRSSLQKYLKGRLSTTGATFSRFAYAAPLAVLYLVGLITFFGYDLPGITTKFVIFGLIGAIGQILATATLVYTFSFRNFAVGTTFSKTETIQTAVFGAIVLGEVISTPIWIAIIVSLVGVMMISMTKSALTTRALLANWFDKTALIGIASGAFFAVSVIGYRAASLGLDGGDFIIRAATTLAFVTVFQTIVMAIYMQVREPGQVMEVLRSWKMTSLVGLVGMLGSVGWITAMTLQNAAYVRALGQVELIFTFAASYLAFGERSTKSEIAGIILVTAGILALLLWR